jgi:hypothetical protein
MEPTASSPLMSIISSTLIPYTSHLFSPPCTIAWGIQFPTLVFWEIHSSHCSTPTCF